MSEDRRTTPDRLSPLPGSPEAHARGCTCPDPGEMPQAAGQNAGPTRGREIEIDGNCPVHGGVAIARGRAGEPGPIDSEGDIADKAAEPELRRSR
jgi:hypothetical protein